MSTSLQILWELREWLAKKEREMYEANLRAASNHQRRDDWTYHGKRQGFYDTINWLRSHGIKEGKNKMLTTFEIKVVANVDTENSNDVEAFKELMRQEAQLLWTQVTVMAPGAEIEIVMNNLDMGTVQLELFNSESKLASDPC